MKLPDLFRRRPDGRAAPVEPCSDWTTDDQLDARLALRKAHRLAERQMRGGK